MGNFSRKASEHSERVCDQIFLVHNQRCPVSRNNNNINREEAAKIRKIHPKAYLFVLKNRIIPVKIVITAIIFTDINSATFPPSN